jgi:PAS domain S-box-containing protein
VATVRVPVIADSQVPPGAENSVTVTVIIENCQLVTSDKRAGMSSPSPLPGGSPETVRILHVDDEPSFADLAATFLQREDDRFRVETAASASEGLGHLADEQFDCVISDYNMPGRDGIEFLRAVRDEYPDLPFVLFTGKGSEEVASKAISAGVTDYLQKGSGTEQYEILCNRVRNAVERRRADRERERMRERMELALEVTESIIFEIDPDTEDLRSHGAVEEIFDEPTGDTESRTDFLERAVHPEDRDQFRELFGRLQRGELDYDVVDYRTNPAVGTQCWMRSHVYYKDSDGSRIVGLARDVTEQKAREQRLQELNERFEHLAEAVPQGLFIVAADYSEVVYANSAAEELYGVESEELAEDPTSWQQHVHPEDLDRLREDVEAQGSGDLEGPQHQEFRIRHPERGTRWLSVDLYPIRENREVDRLAGVATDITERRERETELMRYKQIVEDTDIVATVVAPDGTITYASPSVRRTLGYDPEKLIGEEGFPNQPQTTADAVADAVDDVVEHPGDSRTIQTEFERKDGSVCRVEVTLRNRLDDDVIEGILVSIRELTSSPR